MSIPALFIDVDGVLFGQYGSYSGPQLRPDVVSFLTWCTEHFDCKWLTSYPEDRLQQLFRRLYAHHINSCISYFEWGPGDKDESVDLTSDFYWIEDDPIDMHPKLQGLNDEYGLSRYICVSPYGEHELRKVKINLSMRLLARGYMKDVII